MFTFYCTLYTLNMWYEWALVSEGIFSIIHHTADWCRQKSERPIMSSFNSTNSLSKNIVSTVPQWPYLYNPPINTLHALHTWRWTLNMLVLRDILLFVKKIWSGQILSLGEAVTRWFVLLFLSWGCKLAQIWVSQFPTELMLPPVGNCYLSSDINVYVDIQQPWGRLSVCRVALITSDHCNIRAYTDCHHL